MTRRRLLLVIFAVVVLAEVWSRGGYEKVIRVHLDVLTGMTDKMAATVQSGRRPSPNDLTEMLYPLDRARQFVDQYSGYAERPSYAAFVAVVDAYATFVDAVDAARSTAETWEAFRARAPAMVRAIEAAAAGARAALAAES